MEDLQQKIIELMDLFDDEVVTTSDKIDRPQRSLDREGIDDFMKRNPMAGGGMLVQPGFGGTRQGYAGSKGYVKPLSFKTLENSTELMFSYFFKFFNLEKSSFVILLGYNFLIT